MAVILPTYNEHRSIAACVEGFEALGIVDDVVVVNNNAHADTSGAIAHTTAREVFEPVQGYGSAIRRGLAETAEHDLVAICEPDGTFEPRDLLKLLAFSADVDVVFGSRTVQTFILSGANMGPFLRWGNWSVAKLTEVLFNTVYLSDVGCTFRVLRRSAVDRIAPDLREDGSSFGFEMMLAVARRRIPMVQVPVNYLPRVGESAVTGDFTTSLRLGLTMIGMCLSARCSPPGARR